MTGLDGHKTRNAELIEQLAQHENVVNSTRTIDYFYFTKDKKAAKALCDDLETLGYSVALSSQGSFWSRIWCVSGQVSQVITLSAINEFCEKMCSVGEKRGVVFDGWGMQLD